MLTANLVEIFSSIQGEGPHVGTTTLFVRFGGCDLRCRWCDSPPTWLPAAQCRIVRGRGSGAFESRANPVSIDDALAAAEALELPAHEFASLTGGEPLLQPEAVAALARALRARGPRILLETHGLASDALEQAVDAIDVVSMDWKLSSDVRRASDPKRGAAEPFHAEHEKFLAVARRAPELVVKIVITRASRDEEIDEAVARLEAFAPDATLVLQPVTPFGAVREAPSAERLLSLSARLSARLAKVRVIPQTHKLYGAR
ncbi:MAG TPA: 7-carboxy-7-deazaguanine synthase QueE [Myxococcota bacterium]|nr:7-carboxy-7-deazaguanine synthase QueE [Myxococcota bacterium]